MCDTFYKSTLYTSAVSSTRWVVYTHACKLRDAQAERSYIFVPNI